MLPEVNAVDASGTRAEKFEHIENITKHIQDEVLTLGGVCMPYYMLLTPGFTGLEITENGPLFYTLRVE